MQSNIWTDYQVLQLVELRNKSLGNAEIATNLGKTRNAVCGKINRLKLPLIYPDRAHHVRKYRFSNK